MTTTITITKTTTLDFVEVNQLIYLYYISFE